MDWLLRHYGDTSCQFLVPFCRSMTVSLFKMHTGSGQNHRKYENRYKLGLQFRHEVKNMKKAAKVNVRPDESTKNLPRRNSREEKEFILASHQLILSGTVRWTGCVKMPRKVSFGCRCSEDS